MRVNEKTSAGALFNGVHKDYGVETFTVCGMHYKADQFRDIKYLLGMPLWSFDRLNRTTVDKPRIFDFTFYVKKKGKTPAKKFQFQRYWTNQRNNKNRYDVSCSLYINDELYWEGDISTVSSRKKIIEIFIETLERAGCKLN